MTMPGFTVEASLYDYAGRSDAFRGAVPHGAQPDVSNIVPQYGWYCHGNVCCDDFGNCQWHGRVRM